MWLTIKELLSIPDADGPVLNCSSKIDLEIGLTGTTAITYSDHINITDISDDANVTFFTEPASMNYQKDYIGSEELVVVNVTNAFDKSSSCNLYFNLRGKPMSCFEFIMIISCLFLDGSAMRGLAALPVAAQ